MTFRERVLLGIIASGLALAVLGPCEPVPETRMETVIPMNDDEAGWNCRTMGNKICGIDLERNR